jgi:AraC-like DNA-binding protein
MASAGNIIEIPPVENYLGTSISGWGRSVLLAMLSLDFDGRQVFRDCGLDPDAQGRSLVRNPVAKLQYVWQIAERSVDDRNLLAARTANYLNASSFHALGFGLYASSSIKDMFKRMSLYREVLSSSVNMRIEEKGDEFSFTILDLRPVKSHLTSVVLLLFLLKICHELGGPELSPIRIEVPWSDGDYNTALRQKTDAPIVFDQKHHALTFLLDDVNAPLPSAQSQLASFQDKLCRDYLHSLDEHRHLPGRVRLKILQGLSNDNANIEIVAASLHMSPRSLQRRLSAEGTSFRSILKEARKELALEYARNSELSATQVAYMLGFAGAPQFATSFRSWFGETFTELRQRLDNDNT